ncbi:MAG: hypothetical protein IJN29_00415 [Akkermansia sp.]|nr:hypothetical protein [Akkermansia sp.]
MESQGIIVRTGARKNGKWEIIAYPAIEAIYLAKVAIYPAKVEVYPAKVEVYLAIEEATVAALRGKSRYKIRPPGRSS